MVRIINIYGSLVAAHGDFSQEVKAIKKIINTNTALPLDKIEAEIAGFKEKVFAEDQR